MKSTEILYRCKPVTWSNLPYEEALGFRVQKAIEAMDYYRERSNSMNKLSDAYAEMIAKYTDSKNARDWNKKLIEEIKESK